MRWFLAKCGRDGLRNKIYTVFPPRFFAHLKSSIYLSCLNYSPPLFVSPSSASVKLLFLVLDNNNPLLNALLVAEMVRNFARRP